MLTDPFGRRIDYLRLSATDRCNLRCVYCLPESYSRFAPSEETLSADELARLVSCFAGLGVSKIRITGGEPLVRTGIADLIGRLSRVDGVSDIALSTNGVLLAGLAEELAGSGLKRVNVSLDSLRHDRFSRITRFGKLDDVLAGVDAALAAGLLPVKINVVVASGMNDDEIADFAELTESRPLHVRFIELMPMGETGFFSRAKRMPLGEMMARAAPLEPLPAEGRPIGHGPARYYRRPGGKGTIGFISALSCGFCSSCNRMRLTAQGRLLPCLASEAGLDLGEALRSGAGDAEIAALIGRATAMKPERHRMEPDAKRIRERFMCSVGG